MKISVIIPVYNSADTIEETLKSVLNQSFKDFEIIIVNDGSTDNSLSLIKLLVSNYETIGYKFIIIDQKNSGVSKARNEGIKRANGEYIALLDSDDIWLPEKLRKQIDVLNQFPDVPFVGTLHNNFSLGFPYKSVNNLITVNFNQLMMKMAPLTSTAVIKREILVDTGYYDEGQRYAEDGNLWLRISKKYKMVILNENMVIAGGMKPTFGHSGLSGNVDRMQTGELKNIKDMHTLGYINIFEFLLFTSYSNIKYLRRCIIVKLRKNKTA